jgi:hypothetical protein
MSLNVWTKPSGWNFGNPPGTNAAVSSGNFVPGLQYSIVSIGSTDFRKIGASSNAIGVVFTAENTGSLAGPTVNVNGSNTVTPGNGIASKVAFSERQNLTLELPVQNSTDVAYSVITGKLPDGLRLTGNQILGSAFEVARVTTFTFCIRASRDGLISDRTFNITIEGEDAPEFLTPEGFLNIGDPGELFVMDNTFVDYQITAFDNDTAAGQRLSYFIARGDGSLPPGLVLTDDGRIVGFVQPTLSIKPGDGDGTFDDSFYDAVAYDFAFRPTNGYDSYFYDSIFFDFSLAANKPKKLNRTYQFTITVTDGDTIAKRTFKIFVVGDDYFRADNTTWLNGDAMFTSDVTYLRAPMWLTPSYLGLKRANNYITLILDTYDTESVIYNLEQVNANARATTKKRFTVGPGGVLNFTSDNFKGSVTLTTTLTAVPPTVGHFLTFSGLIQEAFQLNRVDAVEDLGSGEYRLTLFYPLEVDVTDGIEFLIGTVSQLPPGMQFDNNTAEVHGLVPYQPAITKSYTFTVSATKISGKVNTAEYVVIPSNVGVRINQIVINKISFSRISEVLRNFTLITVDNFNIEPNQVSSIDYSNPLEVVVNLSTNIIITNTSRVTIQFASLAGEQASNPKIFTVDILGEVDSAISWVTPSNLGTINANFVSTLSVSAVSTIPASTILYNLISGRLPPGLSLDISGEIVGKVTQYGNDDSDGLTTFTDTVFVNLINGGVAESVIFDSNINGGDAFSVGTELLGGNAATVYQTSTGTTTFDGDTTSFDRDYEFVVEARDQFGYSAVTRTFKISIDTPNQLIYSNIRVKPFLKIEQRSQWSNFIDNTSIFTPASIYRPNDANFGIQRDLSMLVFAGIETKEAAAYVSAIGLNHKKKRFQFGGVKKAVAITPGTKTPVYEIIYIQMLDPMEPGGRRLPNKLSNLGKDPANVTVDASNTLWSRSILDLSSNAPFSDRPSKFITVDSQGYEVSNPNVTEYFPNSISNWRDRLRNWSEDTETFSLERNYLPLWMRSIQPGTRTELDFQLAIPVCYCKVGLADDILLNIKNYLETTGFKFNQLDYTADRYIIDSVEGQTQDKYLVFKNDRITI